MKSVIVFGNPLRTEIQDVPIPIPGPNEILIRVICCGANPKDWKMPEFLEKHMATNQGQDMSGLVEAFGENVCGFQRGDRVAAAHPLLGPNGTYAEYSTAPADLCFLIPSNISFEEACTIPFSFCTAALGFYQRLDIPFPTASSSNIVQSPLIIYGASSAIGAFSLKLAALGFFTKIIVICGEGSTFVAPLNIATHIIDYRKSDVVAAIKIALDGEKCYRAVDAINNISSCTILSEVVEPNGGKISVYLPREDYSKFPKGIFVGITYFGTVHGKVTPFFKRECPEDIDFGYALFRMLPRWLKDGRMTGHPYMILPHGLASVGDALKMLKEGNVSAKKFIFRVSDTPSILKRDQTKLVDEAQVNGHEEVLLNGHDKVAYVERPAIALLAGI